MQNELFRSSSQASLAFRLPALTSSFDRTLRTKSKDRPDTIGMRMHAEDPRRGLHLVVLGHGKFRTHRGSNCRGFARSVLSECALHRIAAYHVIRIAGTAVGFHLDAQRSSQSLGEFRSSIRWLCSVESVGLQVDLQHECQSGPGAERRFRRKLFERLERPENQSA